jgi:hypothetical protein
VSHSVDMFKRPWYSAGVLFAPTVWTLGSEYRVWTCKVETSLPRAVHSLAPEPRGTGIDGETMMSSVQTRMAWIVLLVLATTGVMVPRVLAASPVNRSLATVRFIKVGLGVQKPGGKIRSGRVKQSLFSRYFLQTKVRQKASLRFRDGTVLYMNEHTDATLQSPSVTFVKKGELNEQLKPGTNHQVQTASAVGSAIGTRFDVRVSKGISYFAVIEGVVLVSTPYGNVTITTGQYTTVRKGQAPTAPRYVDTTVWYSWLSDLPAPTSSPKNAALSANGGNVWSSSNYRSGSDELGPEKVSDGSLSTGWHSALGTGLNQWIKVSFGSDQTYRISSVVLDCAVAGGGPAIDALANFQIRVSTTGTDNTNFSTVLSGTCSADNRLTRFDLKAPVLAKYVGLFMLSNHGGTSGVGVTEFEVVTGDPILPAGTDYLLGLINTLRQRNGVPAVTFDPWQSVCSLTHSWHMAYDNALDHTQVDSCVGTTRTSENVGEWAADPHTALTLIFDTMQNEGPCPTPGCPGAELLSHFHYTNMLDPTAKRIGLGIVVYDGNVWVTETFIH